MINKITSYKIAVNALLNNDIDTFVFVISNMGLEQTNSRGETLLWIAAQEGSTNFAELLLKSGANINTTDKDGWTPLHIAVQNSHTNMVRLLLQYNPDINAADKYGNNIISTAVYWANGKGDIIELLLAAGADPYQNNHHGVNAIKLAQTIANYDNISVFKKKNIL